ncbi:hypothetical protein [Salinicola sp. CPA57]|uniref:hypothetical protein n=1 Tax=Salinicola sp. CPA57 TaxID=1949080 RepID=UPI001E288254|nr:hypothetical protein [Salinicola sp. CPA57]
MQDTSFEQLVDVVLIHQRVSIGIFEVEHRLRQASLASNSATIDEQHTRIDIAFDRKGRHDIAHPRAIDPRPTGLEFDFLLQRRKIPDAGDAMAIHRHAKRVADIATNQRVAIDIKDAPIDELRQIKTSQRGVGNVASLGTNACEGRLVDGMKPNRDLSIFGNATENRFGVGGQGYTQDLDLRDSGRPQGGIQRQSRGRQQSHIGTKGNSGVIV